MVRLMRYQVPVLARVLVLTESHFPNLGPFSISGKYRQLLKWSLIALTVFYPCENKRS